MFSKLFKALAVSSALVNPAFANTSFELTQQESAQPESCRLVEQLEQQKENGPLSEEDNETLDFMTRACGVQKGAAGIAGITNKFSDSIDNINEQNRRSELILPHTAGPKDYLCC